MDYGRQINPYKSNPQCIYYWLQNPSEFSKFGTILAPPPSEVRPLYTKSRPTIFQVVHLSSIKVYAHHLWSFRYDFVGRIPYKINAEKNVWGPQAT